MAGRYRTQTMVSTPLIPGQRAAGVVIGSLRPSGREVFRVTWDGVYVGVREPQECEPFVDADGNPLPGETVHLFTDAHLDGEAHDSMGFPVANVTAV